MTRNGAFLPLPKLSHDLLQVLIRASPNLVINDALQDKVWLRSVVSPQTLSYRITLLRDALGDNLRGEILFADFGDLAAAAAYCR